MKKDTTFIFSSIKRLSRELRYKEIDKLIGTEVVLTNVKESPYEIISMIKGNFTSELIFNSDDLKSCQASISKYGIFTIDYHIDPKELDINYQNGMELLKKLGIVEPDLMDDEDMDEDEKDFLYDLSIAKLGVHIDDLDKNEVLLTLFLTTEVEWDWSENPKFVEEGLPKKYWPRTFTIEDACISNISSIWLSKRFYM